MDTKTELYYWVDRLITSGDNIFLGGHYFADSLVSAPFTKNINSPIWAVARDAVSPLEGSLELIHINGISWQLRVVGSIVRTVPFLLSSNQKVRCIYHGSVSIGCTEPKLNLRQAVGDGMPLCGDNWIGVGKWSQEQFLIDAYSDDGSLLLNNSASYCPWWFDHTDSAEGSCFVVSQLP